MEKLFGTTILWSIIFTNITTVAQAQDNSSCFMLDSDGNSVDLGYLCQNSNSQKRRAIAKPNRTQSIRKSGIHVVPIKGRRFGIPVIDVKFNDKYTFEMMLDTGASSVVITEKMAEILRVNHTETVLVSTPSNNSFKMPAGYVYSVGVGELTRKNTYVITSPTMDMGLLGQSFFSQYDLTIKSNVVEFKER
jgi:aspartyl protease family protein